MSALYHFTCEHGYADLGPATFEEPAEVKPGVLITPDKRLPWTSKFAWFTDMPNPDRESTGLTSILTKCDRLAYRYRVLDDDGIQPWTDVARYLPRVREQIEQADGARPRHWYVSLTPVLVYYSPRTSP